MFVPVAASLVLAFVLVARAEWLFGDGWHTYFTYQLHKAWINNFAFGIELLAAFFGRSIRPYIGDLALFERYGGILKSFIGRFPNGGMADSDCPVALIG